MRLTSITTCNNYNKVYLRIPNIYSLKFINLAITGKSLPKVSLYCSFKKKKVIDVSDTFVEGTNVITGHKCNKGHKCNNIWSQM